MWLICNGGNFVNLCFILIFLLAYTAFALKKTKHTVTGRKKHRHRAHIHHELTNYNHEKNALHKYAPSHVVKILAFGDSLTEGMYENGQYFAPFTTKLEDLLNENSKGKRYEVINDGVSGQCVYVEMATRLPLTLRVNSVNLKTVIIFGGTNDLRKLDCDKSVNLAYELIKLHGIAHKQGYKTVVVTIPEADESATQLPYSYERYKQLWTETNEKLRQYALKNPSKTVLCDLAKDFPMASLDPDSKSLYWSDALHPSQLGYERIGELLYQAISSQTV